MNFLPCIVPPVPYCLLASWRVRLVPGEQDLLRQTGIENLVEVFLVDPWRRAWIPLARELFIPMKTHSWKSYVSSYLTKVAGVPETVAEDIAGHAHGSINRDYSGRAPLPQLYEAISKLP